MANNNKNLFGFLPILPHIIIIAVALGGYYFILQNNLFYNWQTFIYYALKTLIVLEIILASARSFLAPIFGIVISAIILFLPDLTSYSLPLVTSADGWQLLVISMIGLLITALMRLK
jgi:hypothetical protein